MLKTLSSSLEITKLNVLQLLTLSFIALGLVITILFPRVMAFLPPAFGIILLITYRLKTKTWPTISKTAFLWSLIVSALIIISSLWSVEASITLDKGLKTLGLTIGGSLFFSVIQNLPPYKSKQLLLISLITLSISALLILIDFYVDGLIYRHIGHGPEEHPLNLSLINRTVIIYTLALITIIPLIFYSALKPNYKIISALLIAIPALLIITKTDSQSCQLALIIGLIFTFIFPYRIKAAWIGLFIILSSLMISAPFVAQYLFTNIAETLSQYSWFQHSYAAARLEIWDFISRHALLNPLYGFGGEATRSIIFDTQMLYQKSNTILHPHNFALQLWIEFGMIGIILAVILFSNLFLNLYKQSNQIPKSGHYSLPLLCGIIAISSTGYGLWQAWWIGCFFFFATIASLNIKSLETNIK